MERRVTVVPEAGLHARPASRFVRTANEYESDVTVGRPGEDPVDAHSMLAVTGLDVTHGEEVLVRAEGPDAEAALDALAAILTTPEGEGNTGDGSEDEGG